MAENYGEWAFLLGVLLAVVVGLFSAQLGATIVYVYAALLILGFVVGLLNIREKDVNSFLVAVIALIVATTSWGPTLGNVLVSLFADVGLTFSIWVNSFLVALAAFISPAAFVVALKAIYNLATRK